MSLWKSISALGVCAGAGLMAQQLAPPRPDTLRLKVQAEKNASVHIDFLSTEFMGPGKVIKGAPYQAVAVTETTQTLADGNRIVHKSTAALARDSEGRTRREQKIDNVGQWSTGDQPPPLVFINDPVSQVNYVLEANTKTARKTEMNEPKVMLDSKIAAEMKATAVKSAGGETGVVEEESLGSKNIEGTLAEGKRLTTTVAAGKIGNERPLVFVNETWYSTELGVLVLSRSSDPQVGETVYKLTNIQRAEPDPALFSVPAEYTVKEGARTFFYQKHEN